MDRRTTIRDTVGIAAFWGIASGFLEAVVRSILPWAPPHRIRLGAYLWWMPAAGNLVWFVVLGTALALVVVLRPNWWRTRWTMAGFAWLGILNALVLLSPPLHRGAAMLLSAGIACALVRIPDRVSRRYARMLMPAIALMSVSVVLVGVGIEAERALRERTALQSPAPELDRPNVLLLVLDNVRAQSLSAYGYRRRTSPTLETFARDGALFERAYATSSWSLPSHASLMTGRWAHELEVDWRVPLGNREPTLAERFGSAGYATAGFVGNGAYTQRESGIARGFAHYEDYQLSLTQTLMSPRFGLMLVNFFQREVWTPDEPVNGIWHRRSAANLNAELLDWLDSIRSRPFFAFVNYFDAHLPYYAPANLPPPLPPLPESWDSQSAGHSGLAFVPHDSLDAYDRAILGIDRELGRLRSALEARGLLESSIIVVTSDHGEEFNEHGFFGHGISLYTPSLQIPLIIVDPGRVVPGARLSQVVSLRDVAATILDLANPSGDLLPGCSLARYWSTDTPSTGDVVFASLREGINSPPEYPLSRGDMHSVITDQWHLIRNGDGSPELFRLAEDPWEQHELYEETDLAPDLSDLLSRHLHSRDSTDCR